MGYLLFDQDEFWYFKWLEVMFIVGGVQSALDELRPGSGLAYSKFANESKEKDAKQVASRVGMLVLYTPAALVSFLFFAYCALLSKEKPEEDRVMSTNSLKVLIFSAALFLHFLKRDLETLFVHRYSGTMPLKTALFVSFGYLNMSASQILAQHKSSQLIPPAVDLTWVGVVVFCFGIVGNFYHHWILRGLRRGEDKMYVIPQGGLFGVFVSPNYIFEIITFIGLFLISQTYVAGANLIFVALYLGSRSYSTKQWYRKKIDGFPENRWALIPYVV